MRKVLTGIGLAAVLTLGPTAAAVAQSDIAAAQEAESNDDDNGKMGLFGLAGLLGLLGLAGLKRRDRRDTSAYETGTSGATR